MRAGSMSRGGQEAPALDTSENMGNSINKRLRTGDVVLVDPADMLKAMKGWTEFDCLFVIDNRWPEEGHMPEGRSQLIHGYRLAKGPTKPDWNDDWNVGDLLICICRFEPHRCLDCGREHEMWLRADGTKIKGQQCPAAVDVDGEQFTGTLF